MEWEINLVLQKTVPPREFQYSIINIVTKGLLSWQPA